MESIMNIATTGIFGLVGSDVVKECTSKGHTPIKISRDVGDITKEEAISSFLLTSKADALIHCAAYTAVDAAEEDRETCFQVNVRATQNLARICKKMSIPIIYISTDYVFDGSGDHAWETTDKPAPINYYGYTKWLGEQAVIEETDQYFIVRTSWVFGEKKISFVKSRLSEAQTGKYNNGNPIGKQISIASNQTGSPTYSKDLAKVLVQMTESSRYGIYHVTNEGFCTWANLAREVYRLVGSETEVLDNPMGQSNRKARRPLNSRLSKISLEQGGFERLRNWQEAVGEFVREELCRSYI